MIFSTKYDFFIDTIVSREERHYCAYLFKWLLDTRQHVEIFLPQNLALGENQRLFYEYTPIREYLHALKRTNLEEYNRVKLQFNRQLVNYDSPSTNAVNDIQKKKIDLAIQTQINGATMVYLVEAKFEEGFNLNQLTLTENYGKILNALFGVEYKLILLGMAYHLNRPDLAKYPQVSWEELAVKIDDPTVKNEIMQGLKYQYEIHPRTKTQYSTLWNTN